jgi:glycogen operon protein
VLFRSPVLRDTKLIAEAWDAAGLYQVGSFSNDTRWAEWNGRFRDDVRAFMLSDRGTVTRLATRIAGSSDLYQPMGRSPLCSINFITSHDGFTLNDLVSYDQKNNLANGEGNLDGDNHNVSWNGGFEGEGAPEAIATQRLVRMKTFATLLFFSQGVPMFPGGDEFGRSQHGNNNAWCQDNETSWLDWSLLKTNHGLFRFFKGCIQLRKNHKVFRREDFFPPGSPEIEQSRTPDIIWQYLWPGEQNWSEDCHGLGFLLRGHKEQDSDFFIMINGERSLPLIFTPPDPIEPKTAWRQIIDTNRETPDDLTTYSEAVKIIRGGSIQVSPLSCAVLEGRIEKYPGRSRKAG